jgi:hypothetical protein
MDDSFIVYENTTISDYSITLNNWEIILNSSENITESNIWEVKIHREDKMETEIESLTNNYPFSFDSTYNYKVTSNIWDKEINNIELLRLDKENKEFVLSKISQTENWLDIWNLEIKNIWWKKEFSSGVDGILNTNEIFIYFGYRGKNHLLKLTKY